MRDFLRGFLFWHGGIVILPLMVIALLLWISASIGPIPCFELPSHPTPAERVDRHE